MSRPPSEHNFKPKQIAVSVAACFALHAAQIQANPTGPSVIHGSVGFSGLGTNALTITNQAGGNAIINWNGFSIGASELTRFQQFANLAVLNRVTGNEISRILGALQSDGRVFLINPNGIVFGASARVDVAGLVASSLNLSDQDFLANRLRFTEVPGAGAVVNNGVLQTQAGGRVYLVAPTVENNGLVQTPGGDIVLAAGKEVELVDGAFPEVTVKLAAATDSAVNVGSLIADSGRIGMFGPLVRNAGTATATAAVAGPGGEIRLVASKDLALEAGSVTAANGTSGGKVLLQAEGGTNLVAGTVEAKGSAGAGGRVDALGVRVGVIGHGIIDASGEAGGGSVRVGGDYQGKNAAVQNAERTYIGSDGVIRADAMTTGDGGRVIVWADGDTRFFGSISARGGAQGGNGGFVETSGKQALAAAGSVSTAAPNGKGGTWLLDPTDINVVAMNGADDGEISTDGQLLFGEGPATSEIGAYGIYSAMARGSNVALQATNNINLQTDVDSTAYGTRSLTMAAGQNIDLSFYNVSTGGDLTLSAGNQITGSTSGNTLQSVNGSVTLSGTANLGSLDITAATGISTGAINANSYDSHVQMVTSGGSIATGPIATSAASDGSSNVTLDAQAGSVAVNGNISTGANGPSYVSITAAGSISTGDVTTGDSGNRNISMTAGSGSISTGSLVTRSQTAGLSGGDVTLQAAGGSISVNGAIDTRGAPGSLVDTCGEGCISAYGSSGGSVSVTASGSLQIGSINTSGGDAAHGADGWTDSNSGGWAGQIDVSSAAGSVTIDSIVASGGNGGNSGAAYGAYGSGGSGGWGPTGINVSGAAGVTIGSITSRGGNGGAGSSAGGGQTAYGGDGGEGGWTVIGSSVGGVNLGPVDLSGGHGGPAGSATDYATGGSGGAGGYLDVTAAAAASVSSFVGIGGNGGAGGSASGGVTPDASGGSGGRGADLYVSASGAASLGPVEISGGSGASGGASGQYAQGGSGGYAGYVEVSASSIAVAPIVGRGGAGGAGGTGGYYVSGGAGGRGGNVYLDATGAVTAGTMDLSAGQGGNAGAGGTYATGGQGYYGGSVSIYGTSIATGAIDARGANGGTGGTLSDGDGYASGGGGGMGGSVYMSAYTYDAQTQTSVPGPIATGKIDVSGGNGANSGAVGSSFTQGGWGGSGGQVGLDGSTIAVAGPILAKGGNGGSVTNASLPPVQLSPGTPAGGWGRTGGNVNINGSGEVSVNVGGTLGAVAIDVSGGVGGAGNASQSPAGDGGQGGSGGFVSVVGTPDMTLFGSVLAGGGNAGAGGTGSASFPGGAGGTGGSAGAIFLDASSVTGTQTGDGIIFVLAGTQFNVQGGAGGAGGADLGAGAGAGGAAGVTGTFNPMSDYFGTIVILDPLSVPEINSAYQQTVQGADQSTVVIVNEDEDKDEDKTKKEFGACKG